MEVEKIEIPGEPWTLFILWLEPGDEEALGIEPSHEGYLYLVPRATFEEITAQVEEKQLLEDDYSTLDTAYDTLAEKYQLQVEISERWKRIALIAISASVGLCGGVAGYAIGVALFGGGG